MVAIARAVQEGDNALPPGGCCVCAVPPTPVYRGRRKWSSSSNGMALTFGSTQAHGQGNSMEWKNGNKTCLVGLHRRRP